MIDDLGSVGALELGVQCNIDAKGRAVRLVSGIVFVVAGAAGVIAALSGFGPTAVVLAIALLALAGGAFQIFEAWKGWCVLRAMGWRTRI